MRSSVQAYCTCPPQHREIDGSEIGPCPHCEHVQEWQAGRAGDPSCPVCHGHGSYADGDALAGVSWMETCECVGKAMPQAAEDCCDV